MGVLDSPSGGDKGAAILLPLREFNGGRFEDLLSDGSAGRVGFEKVGTGAGGELRCSSDISSTSSTSYSLLEMTSLKETFLVSGRPVFTIGEPAEEAEEVLTGDEIPSSLFAVKVDVVKEVAGGELELDMGTSSTLCDDNGM